MSSHIALLLGVNAYLSGTPLQAPENDVAAWSTQLQAVGFAPADIVTVPVPNTANVEAAVGAFVDKLAAAGDGAQGFFFFAGHGELLERAYASLFLADFAGPPLPVPKRGTYANGGALHLDALRQAVQTRAPKATLLAVVDACRVLQDKDVRGPVDSVQDQWSEDRLVLVTAASRGQESYERDFGGTWHGQLTWALTTLLGQWATDRDEAGSLYVSVSVADLVTRAGQLIQGIGRSDQPQTPAVFASAQGKATAFFHFVGDATGLTSAQPLSAPGHEWDANIWGIIARNGQTYGWYRTDAAANAFIQLTGNLPDMTLPLDFNGSDTTTPPPTGVTQTWSIPASVEQDPGTPPTPILRTPDGKIGLEISTDKKKWTWYLPPDSNQKYLLPKNTALTNGSFTKQGNTKKRVDPLTEQIGPWGATGKGNVYDAQGNLAGTFSTASGVVTLTLQEAFPSTLAGWSFVAGTPLTLGSPTTVYTAPKVGWTWVQNDPSGTIPLAVQGTIGVVSSGQTWTFYAPNQGTTLMLPATTAFTGSGSMSGLLFSYTLNFS